MSDWRAKAACVAEVAKAETPEEAGAIADMWYPETIDGPITARQAARDKAIAICRRCPVEEQCTADRGYILVTTPGDENALKAKPDRDGIRGGVDANKNLRSNRAQCGTPSGYYRHRRAMKEDPCDACKAAHTADQREREQRRKAAA